MKATRTITLRIPKGWAGRVGSSDVRGMLAEFLQRPMPLALDPGPGDARISLSLPARAVKVVSGLLNDTESGALRRVVAANLGVLRSPTAVPLRIPSQSLPARLPSRGRHVYALPPGRPAKILTVGVLPPSQGASLPTSSCAFPVRASLEPGLYAAILPPRVPPPGYEMRKASLEPERYGLLAWAADFVFDNPWLLVIAAIVIAWLLWHVWRWLAPVSTPPVAALPAFKPWTPMV